MQSKKIVIMGGGLVGSTIAADLSQQFDVTVADIDKKSLEKIKDRGIKTLKAELSVNETLRRTVRNFDIVVGALPGFMGYNMIKQVIEEKREIVDISFSPEDPLELDEHAKKHGVTVVTDCGVAPGVGNIILGRHNSEMKVEKYQCYVGGLPFVREWPYEYKAVFSPRDVIEEYIRPARYVENGRIITREALSDPELLFFPQVGTLEAWNTDGLRSLLKTMEIPNMIEKTLRYPGSVEYLKVLRETGYFSYDPVKVNGTKIRPIDLTAKLLFPKWQMKPGEEDFTAMRIYIEGISKDSKTKYLWEMFDRYDKTTGTMSMARTTGFACSAAVNLIASGKFNRKGVNPPEHLGEKSGHFKFIMDYMKNRGVIYNFEQLPICNDKFESDKK